MNKKGDKLGFKKVKYEDLSSKAQETYNFQRLSAKLVEYGFSTNWLNVDFEAADFIGVHFNGVDILKVQLKGRLTIDKKYLEKEIYISWPDGSYFYFILHDQLVRIIGETTNWLESDSWKYKNGYSSMKPSRKTLEALSDFRL